MLVIILNDNVIPSLNQCPFSSIVYRCTNMHLTTISQICSLKTSMMHDGFALFTSEFPQDTTSAGAHTFTMHI